MRFLLLALLIRFALMNLAKQGEFWRRMRGAFGDNRRNPDGFLLQVQVLQTFTNSKKSRDSSHAHGSDGPLGTRRNPDGFLLILQV